MRKTCSDSASDRAAVAACGGDVVASSQPCPVGGEPMRGRRASTCSDTYRAAKIRQSKVARQAEIKQAVLELLGRALAKLEE